MAGTIAGVVGAVSKEFCVSMESGLDGRNNLKITAPTHNEQEVSQWSPA